MIPKPKIELVPKASRAERLIGIAIGVALAVVVVTYRELHRRDDRPAASASIRR